MKSWVIRAGNITLHPGMRAPLYSEESGQFTILLHHSGNFVTEKNRDCIYAGGEVTPFDFCHKSEMSMLELDNMLRLIGYSGLAKFYFWDGNCFRFMFDNEHALELDQYVALDRVVEVFVEYIEVDKLGSARVKSGPTRKGPNISKMEIEIYSGSDNSEQSLGESSEYEEFVDSEYSLSDDENLIEATILQRKDANAHDTSLNYSERISTLYVGQVSKSTREAFTAVGEASKDNAKVVEVDEGYIETDPDELDSGNSSNDEKRPRRRFLIFNAKTDMDDLKFCKGMLFKNAAEFRMAVRTQAIKWGKKLRFCQNDSNKVRVKCAQEECPWVIYASTMQDEQTFQVKTYEPNHICGRSFHVKHATSTWMANTYAERIKLNPTWPLASLKQTIERENWLKVGKSSVARAKKKALDMVDGTEIEQYAMLWNYCEEIKKSNPGTTVKIKARRVKSGTFAGKTRFKRLYICWDPLKKGFLAGCRPLIGLDGCHLKTSCGGILLAAVGIDANNCVYPFAYGIVENERYKTWFWFLDLLQEDLNIENSYGWTFISDKQKGLLEAIAQLFPNSEHRHCVRHLHNNFKIEHRGLALKDLLWKAAMATRDIDFKSAMNDMCALDLPSFEWLSARDPSRWSRAYFRTWCKCDILLNNLCESFNGSIIQARNKPIISMLEDIRHWLMERLQVLRQGMLKWHGKMCPKIHNQTEKIKEEAGSYISRYSGNDKYEVEEMYGERKKVDLRQKTCSCRKWDLNGIPCRHAVACIAAIKEDPLDYVESCYSKETFLKCYNHCLSPMDGRDAWPKTSITPLLPPECVKRTGRPKKARRRESDEPSDKHKNKLSKRGLVMSCKYCGQKGHNKRKCSIPLVQVAQQHEQPTEYEGRVAVEVQQNEQTAALPSNLTSVSNATSSKIAGLIANTTTNGRKKLSKRGTRTKCSKCQQHGHNRVTCKNQDAQGAMQEKAEKNYTQPEPNLVENEACVNFHPTPQHGTTVHGIDIETTLGLQQQALEKQSSSDVGVGTGKEISQPLKPLRASQMSKNAMSAIQESFVIGGKKFVKGLALQAKATAKHVDNS